MGGVRIVIDQQSVNILEEISLSKIVTIVRTHSHAFTDEELRASHVKKNKIFNLTTSKKQWDPLTYDQLATKINKAKLMNFITAEPKRFHPYLMAEFYQKVVIADDEQSFSTKVHDTQFQVSLQFLATEDGLSSTGASISSYLDCQSGVERAY